MVLHERKKEIFLPRPSKLLKIFCRWPIKGLPPWTRPPLGGGRCPRTRPGHPDVAPEREAM